MPKRKIVLGIEELVKNFLDSLKQAPNYLKDVNLEDLKLDSSFQRGFFVVSDLCYFDNIDLCRDFIYEDYVKRYHLFTYSLEDKAMDHLYKGDFFRPLKKGSEGLGPNSNNDHKMRIDLVSVLDDGVLAYIPMKRGNIVCYEVPKSLKKELGTKTEIRLDSPREEKIVLPTLVKIDLSKRIIPCSLERF